MIYKLVSENLTQVGGPMQMAHSSTNWVKYFKVVKHARRAAETDYRKCLGGKGPKVFKWIGGKNKSIHSEDLGFVMYHISPIKVEDE
jgi:hypothetical protein